jgi:serine/threonine protein kinase
MQFGSYTLNRRVSIGGSGIVYDAVGKDGTRVALKRLLPTGEEDPENRAMFKAESQLASQLSHHRINAVHDYGEVDDHPFIAFYFIDGVHVGTVRKKAYEEGRGLSAKEVAAVGIQVAEGLGYLHGYVNPQGRYLGIVHRDISPQNLLTDSSGAVTIVDLGIAYYEGRELETRAGMRKGKLSYMSPEQVRGERLDGRSDLFSLGVVLYELYSGRRLFRADSLMDTYERIEKADVPALKPADEDGAVLLVDVIHRCLQRLPADRPEDAEGVVLGLREVLGCDEPNAIVLALKRQLWPDGAPLKGLDLDEYRKGHSSAEERGEETTDEREVSEITLYGLSVSEMDEENR